MNNVVLIENDKVYKMNTFDELVKIIVCEYYYDLPYNEQQNILKTLAFENEIVKGFNEGSINTQDETAYILSLLKLNIITIMESKEAEILSKYIDKTNMDGNYIILNSFADKLLDNYLNGCTK